MTAAKYLIILIIFNKTAENKNINVFIHLIIFYIQSTTLQSRYYYHNIILS